MSQKWIGSVSVGVMSPSAQPVSNVIMCPQVMRLRLKLTLHPLQYVRYRLRIIEEFDCEFVAEEYADDCEEEDV